jgi:hypothetical protein
MGALARSSGGSGCHRAAPADYRRRAVNERPLACLRQVSLHVLALGPRRVAVAAAVRARLHRGAGPGILRLDQEGQGQRPPDRAIERGGSACPGRGDARRLSGPHARHGKSGAGRNGAFERCGVWAPCRGCVIATSVRLVFHLSEIMLGVLVTVLHLNLVPRELRVTCTRQVSLVVLPRIAPAVLRSTRRLRSLRAPSSRVWFHNVSFDDARRRLSTNRVSVTATELRHNRVAREVGANPFGNAGPAPAWRAKKM